MRKLEAGFSRLQRLAYPELRLFSLSGRVRIIPFMARDQTSARIELGLYCGCRSSESVCVGALVGGQRRWHWAGEIARQAITPPTATVMPRAPLSTQPGIWECRPDWGLADKVWR